LEGRLRKAWAKVDDMRIDAGGKDLVDDTVHKILTEGVSAVTRELKLHLPVESVSDFLADVSCSKATHHCGFIATRRRDSGKRSGNLDACLR